MCDAEVVNDAIELDMGVSNGVSNSLCKNTQKRRHSLWLPSPSNCLNTANSGLTSYDPSNDKVSCAEFKPNLR